MAKRLEIHENEKAFPFLDLPEKQWLGSNFHQFIKLGRENYTYHKKALMDISNISS